MTDVRTMRALFIGRDDTYVVQNDDGSYVRVDGKLTDEIIEDHLAGKITIGVYQHDLDSRIKWIVFDFDESKPDALKLFNYLRSHERYRDACLLEDTGGRGAHVWVFFNPAIPACVGRYLAEEILEKVQVKCEIFPKQDKISPKGFGNQVRLPLGIHRKYGRFGVLIDPVNLEDVQPVKIPDEVIDDVKEILSKREEEEKIAKTIPTGLIPWWVECKAFDRIIYGNIDEGTRNECGFWLARLFRNSLFPSWMTETLLLCWNQHLKCPPLPDGEVQTIVRSVYSKGYSVGKLSLKKNPLTSVYCEGCIKMVCVKRDREKRETSPLIKPGVI
jgi:hypothetical protein